MQVSQSPLNNTMPFDVICVPKVPVDKSDAGSAKGGSGTTTYECDYDKNPTSLYEAMEDRAWIPAMAFFKTGSWERGMFFQPVLDPLSPERQAKTWVTRFEQNGSVRWSQLPLHAAIIFGAPLAVIQALVELYPQGVRCTDDQHMLPLHLAMKYNADDSIVNCLLTAFPESIFTKDIRGRLPTEVTPTGEKPNDRSQIIEQIIAVMTKTLTKRHGAAMQDNIADLKDDLVLQSNLNAELEQSRNELEAKYQKAHSELIIANTKLDELRAALKAQQQRQLIATTASAQDVGQVSPKDCTSSILGSLEGSQRNGHTTTSKSKTTAEIMKESKHSKSSSSPKEHRATESSSGRFGTPDNNVNSKSKPSSRRKRPERKVLEPVLGDSDGGSTSKRSTRGFFKGFGAKE